MTYKVLAFGFLFLFASPLNPQNRFLALNVMPDNAKPQDQQFWIFFAGTHRNGKSTSGRLALTTKDENGKAKDTIGADYHVSPSGDGDRIQIKWDHGGSVDGVRDLKNNRFTFKQTGPNGSVTETMSVTMAPAKLSIADREYYNAFTQRMQNARLQGQVTELRFNVQSFSDHIPTISPDN